MKATHLLSSLACALTMGLATCGNAQQVSQVRGAGHSAISHSAKQGSHARVPAVHAPINGSTPNMSNVNLLKALKGKPLYHLTKDQVHFHRQGENGPKPLVTADVYDNLTEGTFFFTISNGPYDDELDDFNIVAGTVSDPSGNNVSEALLTDLTIALANDDPVVAPPTTASTIVLIAIWDKVDTTAGNVGGAASAANNLLGGFYFDLTDLPADGYVYFVSLSALDPVGIFFHRDIGSASTVTYIHTAYAIQSAFITDPTTLALDSTTPIQTTFCGDGFDPVTPIGTSHDYFWIDLNNDYNFTFSNPGEFFYFGGKPYTANFGLTFNADNAFYSASGTLTLDGLLGTIPDPLNPANNIPPLPQKVTFVLHDNTLVNADQTFTGTVTVSSDGATPTPHATVPYAFDGFIAGDNYTLEVKTDKSLRKNIPILISATTPTNVTGADATLFGGDANNDNHVDGGDFGSLVNSYGDSYDPTDAGASPFDIAADFTGDGNVDSGDFGILVNNYGFDGDLLL